MKVIVIGGGQVGAYVARIMVEAQNDVCIIDNREKVIQYNQQEFKEEQIIYGDGADPKILERAGIYEADVVAAVTGADEINLVASTIAKFEFGIEKVIARVNNPKNEWLFTRDMGVDIPISQANLLARVISNQIDMNNMITLMKLNDKNASIVEVTVNTGSKADGATVKDIVISDNIVLIAVQRGNENMIVRGETVFQAGDHIFAYTDAEEDQTLYNLTR
ncbi:NAD-binding protein [Marinilactibacillus sp. XAAS-LB27]|uniref:potassium channel family protein n=1 Tax=Marinilactibacillus sp. XAAS-LB27 TaxID=3114538 RepID=UPI002E181A50|nr:NAD-binding protein [Marinilactibacillus sp. XAAS-LB27]